jgi:hypothetical protein
MEDPEERRLAAPVGSDDQKMVAGVNGERKLTDQYVTLLEVMDDLLAGRFEKKLVSSASTEENAEVLSGRTSIGQKHPMRKATFDDL